MEESCTGLPHNDPAGEAEVKGYKPPPPGPYLTSEDGATLETAANAAGGSYTSAAIQAIANDPGTSEEVTNLCQYLAANIGGYDVDISSTLDDADADEIKEAANTEGSGYTAPDIIANAATPNSSYTIALLQLLAAYIRSHPG
jgi:hypothetical protein